MERNLESTPLPLQNASERGAGGKLRRQSARRPPTTPYARPPQNQVQRSRWLSRLVDPACRLIAGGASRILPSLFSLSSEDNAFSEPNNGERYHDESHSELEQHARDAELKRTPSDAEPESEGPDRLADRSKSSPDFVAHMQDKMGPTDGEGLSEIEKLMEGKVFSRFETDRLLEIIKSRAIDCHDVVNEKKTGIEEAERPAEASEDLVKSVKGKEKSVNRVQWEFSTPLQLEVMQDEVGASPVEIARAYMGRRTSDNGSGSKSLILKDERALVHDDEFPSRSYIPSPSPKPTTCWPGAMLQDQRGCVTPQSERGRVGLHHFPRTPYSRTIYSKSRSKLTKPQEDSTKRLSIFSSPFQQLQTPSYGQIKSGSKALNIDNGSVGPIRRIRHKAVLETPSKGPGYNHSSKGYEQVGNSDIYEGSVPSIKNNLEGGSNFSPFQSMVNKTKKYDSVPTVHPHSSQMARSILEHLERNPPTPKDKSAELKLVTSWRTRQNSEDLGGMQNERNILPNPREAGFPVDRHQAGNMALDHSNEKRVKSLSEAPQFPFKVPSPRGMSEVNSDLHRKALPPNAEFNGFSTTNNDGAGPLPDSRKIQEPQDGVQFISRKPPSGNKPALPSISISKPEQRWTFPTSSSTGFTFPVSSTSSGVSSDPPTPSIMPSLSTSVMSQPTAEQTVPSYSFGTNRSTPPLVFSFPSSSSEVTNDDVSDIKFNFGSDEERISFSLTRKDAVCF